MVARLMLAAFAFLFAPLVALADQRDPRLDQLFITLQKTKDADVASETTQEIRRIWTESKVSGVTDDLIESLMWVNDGNMKAAIEGYDAVIAAAPDFAEAYAQRAAAYYAAGLFLPAIADAEKALALEGRHFDVFAGLGQIYLALGDLTGAERAFAQALAINPHLTDVREGLEQVKGLRARREL